MNRLTSLNVDRSELVTDAALRQLTNLTYLSAQRGLRVTSFSLSVLTNLTYLNIYRTDVADSGMSKLTNLTSLHCSDFLSEFPIRSYSSLTALHYPQSFIPVTASLPFSNILSLSLDVDSRFVNVNQFSFLTYLDISEVGQKFDAHGFPGPSVTSLKELVLGPNSILSSVEHSNLISLETLRVFRWPEFEVRRLAKGLTQFRLLSSLSVNSSHICEDAFDSITQLSSLRSMTLRGNTVVSRRRWQILPT